MVALKRKSFTLTDAERIRFAAICRAAWPREGYAAGFWREVAAARGLDPATVIGNVDNPSTFTALPWDHGMWWCWPHPLRIGRQSLELMTLH
jgi:hypothetical protein